jgi:peptide/nickel transport system permease protein
LLIGCGLVFAVFVLGTLFAPVLTPYRATELAGPPFGGMSARHWLGTDNLGRDVYARVLYGSRVSLYVGAVAVGLGTGSGALIGMLTGYLGGAVDAVVQRLMDAVLALPALVLALAIVSVLGPGLNNALIAVAIVLIPSTSRVVRSVVLAMKESLYLDAARVVGATDTRILLAHVFPNVVPFLLVLMSLSFGDAILAEAGLSFLGLGTQPPTPSWGLMLSQEGRQFLLVNPLIALAPGVALSVVVLAVNLLGDALRDRLDPRLRRLS